MPSNKQEGGRPKACGSPMGRLAVLVATLTLAAQAQPLPNTKELTRQDDLAMQMVANIDSYLTQRLKTTNTRRPPPDPASRQRLKQLIGAQDPRVPYEAPTLQATLNRPAKLGQTSTYEVLAISWPTLEGIDGEGLLLRPTNGPPKAHVVAIPDADQTPEQWLASDGTARMFAEQGCLVVIPFLINRDDKLSGNPALGRMTNQPHREFIHRMAYEMGRHIIGYEVQKVLAVIDGFERAAPSKPIGVYGHGEGGLLALYSAAIDERIRATVVSGYFNKREAVVWSEPIYRNVWSQLETWGDAELAALARSQGRSVTIVASPHPQVPGPPPERQGRRGAASGSIVTPAFDAVQAEAGKARVPVVLSGAGRFLEVLGINPLLRGAAPAPTLAWTPDRLERQFLQLVDYTQKLMRQSHRRRDEFLSKAAVKDQASFAASMRPYRDQFWQEVQGKMPPATESLSKVESRKIYDTPKFTGHEVLIPVWGDIYAYGILLLPRDLKPGERRPVVVAQHGLEGRPQHLVDPPDDRLREVYKRFAAELAEQGYIVFAPQNPYIGMETFRILMRKANPVKLSLFSFIIGQHNRILDWLETLPNVDSSRIGFYGLSYGGKTAMRAPAVIERYALSICSADFNEWVVKVTSTDETFSYMFTQEYDMLEFNLGRTFNYYEQAMLIAPRPFMVERGHRDGVGIDEWVAHEYAKIRRLYANLGIPERTRIEYFNGPHQIHGVGTYEFLREHLRWQGR